MYLSYFDNFLFLFIGGGFISKIDHVRIWQKSQTVNKFYLDERMEKNNFQSLFVFFFDLLIGRSVTRKFNHK